MNKIEVTITISASTPGAPRDALDDRHVRVPRSRNLAPRHPGLPGIVLRDPGSNPTVRVRRYPIVTGAVVLCRCRLAPP